MKVRFRVFNASGGRLYPNQEFNSSSAAWRRLEESSGLSRTQLKSMQYRVKRHVDVSDTEEAIAVTVAEEVIGPKKVGLIRGILGAIFK